jgi:hypothetical protein
MCVVLKNDFLLYKTLKKDKDIVYFCPKNSFVGSKYKIINIDTQQKVEKNKTTSLWFVILPHKRINFILQLSK